VDKTAVLVDGHTIEEVCWKKNILLRKLKILQSGNNPRNSKQQQEGQTCETLAVSIVAFGVRYCKNIRNANHCFVW
jgi:hypothetical protein